MRKLTPRPTSSSVLELSFTRTRSAMASSFLLPLLAPCLLLLSAAAAAPVLDTDGNPVLRGAQYYVLAPQVRGQANLGLSPTGPCPLDVYLKPYPYGPAAVFFPDRSSQGTNASDAVLVGEELSVVYATPTKCSSSTQWTLNGKTGVVTTGGALSTPAGFARFRIARYEFPNRNFYQFLSCPAAGKTTTCSKVGVTTEQLLRVTNEVLVVSFMKVK